MKYLFIVLLVSISYSIGEIRLNVKYDGKPMQVDVYLDYISEFGDKEYYDKVGTTNEYGNLLINSTRHNYRQSKPQKQDRLKNGKYLLSIKYPKFHYKSKNGLYKTMELKPVTKTIIIRNGTRWKPDKKTISINLKKDDAYYKNKKKYWKKELFWSFAIGISVIMIIRFFEKSIKEKRRKKWWKKLDQRMVEKRRKRELEEAEKKLSELQDEIDKIYDKESQKGKLHHQTQKKLDRLENEFKLLEEELFGVHSSDKGEVKDSNKDNINYKSTGTGFLIDAKGHIATNYHVIRDAIEINAYFAHRDAHYKGKVVIENKENDLAVIKLENFLPDLQMYPFNGVGKVNMGDNVHTIGFPLGDVYSIKPRLSSGVINSEFGIKDDDTTFQVDIPIQPGNSGGVVFNDNCEIVGVISSSINEQLILETTGAIAQNMNYAIKAKYLRSLLDDMGRDFNFSKNIKGNRELKNIVKDITPFVCLIEVIIDPT